MTLREIIKDLPDEVLDYQVCINYNDSGEGRCDAYAGDITIDAYLRELVFRSDY